MTSPDRVDGRSEHRPAPVIPAYGSGSLSDLMPAVATSLAVPGFADVLGLQESRRVCVLLVDGLGWEGLRRRLECAPFLATAIADASVLTAGFPATTATSLASLGTGVPPGRHGVLGYQVAMPGAFAAMNVLRWRPPTDPATFQPRPTVFERAAADGVTVTQVGPARFADAGLTMAVLRGTRYVPAETPGEVIAGALDALRAPSWTLCYAYHGDLDRTGHSAGVTSPSWAHELGQVDRLVEQLAGSLPSGTVLYVVADHGMVDVAPEHRIDVESDPELAAGVRLLTGEARARYVHTEPGAEADVAATWQARLGDRMWIVSRDEAIDGGWFGGPVSDEHRARIGDVIAAAHGEIAAIAGRSEPGEARLVGMHGSLTAAEQHVPLLRFGSPAEQG